MKKVLNILFLIILLPVTGYSFEWKTYTSSDGITSITYSEGNYWAATTGGVLQFDPLEMTAQKFTNTEGLGDNEILGSAFCNSYFWFCSLNGKLSRYDIQSRSFKQFQFIDRDGASLKLNNLYADGTNLWVSSNIGVSLFDTERHGGEIKETYRRFGNIPSGTDVRGVAILNDTVWVATANGIAYAPAEDPNLLDYTHWKSVSTSEIPELPSNDFVDIVAFNENIWAVTDFMIVELIQENNQVEVRSFLGMEDRIYSVAERNDTLYFAGEEFYAYTRYLPEGGRRTSVIPIQDTITAIGFLENSDLIFGTLNNGIMVQGESEFRYLSVPGIARNQAIDVLEDDEGNIRIAHDRQFISSYDGDMWDAIEIQSNRLLNLEKDNDGNIWTGTFGNGVFEILATDQVIEYDTTGTSLIGNSDSDGENYIVVYDIDFDHNGLLWFSCYRGLGRQPVAFYDPVTEMWDGFSSLNFKSEAKILTLHSDTSGLWTGFEDDGIFLIKYGEDPFDKSDLVYIHYTRDNLLPSDRVNLIEADNNGVIWVGTDMGLVYFDPGINRFIRTILPEQVSPQITAIEFDVRNNMWIGTENGLAFRETGENDFIYFNTENSDIVDDRINALFTDTERKLWIATDKGVSVLNYDIGAVTEIIDDVYAYPNPFILRTDDDKVFFNYIDEVSVDIFTLDGRRINTVLSNAGWDGTNEEGEKVASGMYLFYINDGDGNSHTGKIAVIRK